jgi:hypothetical protein
VVTGGDVACDGVLSQGHIARSIGRVGVDTELVAAYRALMIVLLAEAICGINLAVTGTCVCAPWLREPDWKA